MKRPSFSRLAAALLAILQAFPARAADDAFGLFEEEARVVTAARRSQSIAEAPLAVDVVTAEEIAASGASNLWDLLRFRAGMDVLDGRSIDGNRAVVSARGIPHEFAGNLLLMIDGRSVSSLNQGGVYWEQLPVSIKDVERIEIVRGPGAALYGTGAGVGVVHIITKKPGRSAALELDARGGNRSRVQAHQAAEGPLGGKAAIRVGHTFQQDDGGPLSAGSAVSDHMRKNALNLRASFALSERADADVFAGGSRSSLGLASGQGQTGTFENGFVSARLAYRPSEASSLEVSASRNDARTGSSGSGTVTDGRQLQHDAEVLHRLGWGDGRLNTAYGASFRDIELYAPQIYGTSRPRLRIHRAFLQQSVRAGEILTLHGAASVEESSVAGPQPNYQAAAVAALTERDSLRVSYSVSHTLRDFIPLYGRILAGPTTITGNPGLTQPYKITSYEAGYHGSYLGQRLQADVSAFYTRIDNFHQVLFKSFAFPTTTLQFQNYDDAIARGGEIQAKYRFAHGRWAYANYSYVIVSDKRGDEAYITRAAPTHKANVGAASSLGRGLKASVDLGYKDRYLIQSVGSASRSRVPASWRLDMRLAWELPWLRDAEGYVAGQNLLKPTHTEFPNGVDVARTWSAGVSVKLGGSP